MQDTKALSIQDIMRELGCKIDRARQIMLEELPHYDISAAGAKKRTLRCLRKDFEAWLKSRQHRPGNERLEAFARRYVR